MESIAFATNEGRSKYLSDSLSAQKRQIDLFDFDQIDFATKCAAGILSFKHPRSEWWGNYQMHPLVQRKRRKNLLDGMSHGGLAYDFLLMWGSWFHPFKSSNLNIPYYVYIDQSRSLHPTKDEPRTSSFGRRKSYKMQVETYQDCAGIFCMSEWAKQQTLESHSYLPEEKVHVVGWGPCGIDIAQEKLDLRKKEALVLHVSNDFHRKGVDFIIKTAATVLKKDPKIKFVVVGEDPQFRPSNYPSNLEFLGRITERKKLENLFRRASIFFLPHRFDRNPHVLVEAMGAGSALVASRQGGAIEVIENQGTGHLCEIGHIDAYADAIYTTLNDNKLFKSMATNSKMLAASNYNWDTIAKKMLSHIARG